MKPGASSLINSLEPPTIKHMKIIKMQLKFVYFYFYITMNLQLADTKQK